MARADRHSAAVAEAVAIARAAGVRVDAPRVLRDTRNVVAHLAPSPVVAKIGFGGIPEFGSGLATELSVLEHLALAGAPAVRPSRLLEPGPHSQGEATIIFLHLEPHDTDAEPSARAVAEALQGIHTAMRDYPLPLPPYRDQLAVAHALLDPARTPALEDRDRNFLLEAHDRLVHGLPAAVREQPLHGDPWPGNILMSPRGAVYLDFEAACAGPREWDWTMVGEESAALAQGLDTELLGRLHTVRTLATTIWCYEQYGASREVDAAARYHLGELRRALRC